MSAKEAQHDAAECLFKAIVATLEKHEREDTLTGSVLQDLARAYAEVSTSVPEQGPLGIVSLRRG